MFEIVDRRTGSRVAGQFISQSRAQAKADALNYSYGQAQYVVQKVANAGHQAKRFAFANRLFA